MFYLLGFTASMLCVKKKKQQQQQPQTLLEVCIHSYFKGVHPYGELMTCCPSTAISFGTLGPQMSKSTNPT